MKDAQGYPAGTKYFHCIEDSPYSADAILPNGIVAYTQGETFPEFCNRNAGKRYSNPVTWEEYEKAIIAWEDQMTAQPAEIIDARTFDDALSILPPCRWGMYAGITGNLVRWYASNQGRYIRFVARSTIGAEVIRAKWDEVMG